MNGRPYDVKFRASTATTYALGILSAIIRRTVAIATLPHAGVVTATAMVINFMTI